MNVRPLHNYLIIEKIDDVKVSEGGVQLVRADPLQPKTGKVLAIGPGVLDDEDNLVTCGVEVGDIIAYLNPEAKTFEIDNEKFTMLRGGGVVGKINRQ